MGYEKNARATGGKLITNKWKTSAHIFECGSHCRCNKARCAFSLLGSMPSFRELEAYSTREVTKTAVHDNKVYARKMLGLFTNIDIPANSFVINYRGEVQHRA